MTTTPPRVEHEALRADLRRRIIHLDLLPGTHLREQALAVEYGVSRTPIRRILEQLAYEGLVTLRPGSGAAVSVVDFQELREVWALRLKIAELVGSFVRLPAGLEILARLDACLARLDALAKAERSPEDAGELLELYDEFHAAMLAVMTNGPLRTIHDQLYAQTARMFAQMLPTLDIEEEIEAMREEISLSRQACTQRSGAELCEVRRKHMHMLLERLDLTLIPTFDR